MKKRFIKPLIVIVCTAVLLLAGAVIYYYIKWRPLWQCEEPLPVYQVMQHHDDTLRVVFVGDSWVGMRQAATDSALKMRLATQIGRPVKICSSGRGGAKSRDIYRLMFETGEYGTKPLIASGPDYCVISAGINDAAANLGTGQYVHHVKLIIDLLCRQGIRPILLEAPNVNVWTIYGDKPMKDLLGDFIKSRMTGCGMFCYSDYREALEQLAENDEQVLVIPVRDWNGEHLAPNPDLFLNDSIHLNDRGYARLDSCIAATIARDLE